jgi:hypothetical protein
MAVVVTASGKYQYWDTDISTRQGQLDESSTITFSRIVQKRNVSTGAIIPFNIIEHYEDAVDDGVFPIQNEAFTIFSTTWHTTTKLRSINLTALENGSARADLIYSTKYVVDPNSTTTILYALPSSCEYSSQLRTMAIYRSGWSTNPPTTSSNSTADIGGTSLSGADGSQSLQVGQVRFRMRFTQDASVVSMSTAAAGLITYANTINNATIGPFASYTLICEGVSIGDAGDPEYYEVVFDFLFDPYRHFSQVATLDADGRVKMTSAGAISEVKWQRLPRTGLDFNAIFAADTLLQTKTLKGWWT